MISLVNESGKNWHFIFVLTPLCCVKAHKASTGVYYTSYPFQDRIQNKQTKYIVKKRIIVRYMVLWSVNDLVICGCNFVDSR